MLIAAEAIVTAATTGAAGAWIAPAVVGGLGGALDYSAPGPVAIRDRVAVVLYYASLISFAEILGWNGFIRDQIGADYSWRMAGALVSLITHSALLCAFFGWPKGLAKQLSKKIKFVSSDSSANKINQTLLGWTTAAALSATLSGDAGWGHLVGVIGRWTTGAPGHIVTWIFHQLGG